MQVRLKLFVFLEFGQLQISGGVNQNCDAGYL